MLVEGVEIYSNSKEKPLEDTWRVYQFINVLKFGDFLFETCFGLWKVNIPGQKVKKGKWRVTQEELELTLAKR